MHLERTIRTAAIGALCGLALTASPVLAGDAAQVDVIGFSQDGAYFAFEQYGEQDGSGMAYSDIVVVDVAKNEWAAKPVRVTLDPEDDADQLALWHGEDILAKVRDRARFRAGKTLRTFGLMSPAAGDERLADYAEPWGMSTCERKSFDFAVGPDRLRLQVNRIPIPGSDNYYGDPLQLLELKLVQPYAGPEIAMLDEQGNPVVPADKELCTLQRDEKLPEYRGMSYDYDVSGVYLGGPKGMHLVVVVGYHEPGFEGPDKRYLVVSTILE